MKLSCTKGDPGYDEWLDLIHAKRIPKVYLDGEFQRYVKSADEERGEVVVLLKDGDGRWKLTPGGVATETKRGTVRIEVPGLHEAVPALAQQGAR